MLNDKLQSLINDHLNFLQLQERYYQEQTLHHHKYGDLELAKSFSYRATQHAKLFQSLIIISEFIGIVFENSDKKDLKNAGEFAQSPTVSPDFEVGGFYDYE